MRIETKRLVIRDLEQKDKENIFKIIWQKGCLTYMKDWADNIPSAESLTGYVNWHQSQANSIDMYKAKRYAITIKGEDNLIGTIGMGLDDELNEVEIAYFMDEAYQNRGYCKEALAAFYDWCMSVSDLPYMIITTDIMNEASSKVAQSCGFTLYEKRTPIGYKKSNMISDSYLYFKKCRS